MKMLNYDASLNLRITVDNKSWNNIVSWLRDIGSWWGVKDD